MNKKGQKRINEVFGILAMTSLNDALARKGIIPGIMGEPSSEEIYISNEGQNYRFVYILTAHWDLGFKITLAAEIDGGRSGQHVKFWTAETVEEATEIIERASDNLYKLQELQELWGEEEIEIED